MKKTTLLLLAVVMMAASSCDQIEEALDIEFSATFQASLQAVVDALPMKAAKGDFSASATIDPMSNSQFAEHAARIKDIQIEKVEGKILSISKPTRLVNATLSMTSEGMTPAEWTVSDVQLAVGTILLLDNSAGQFDRVQSILNTKNTFTVAANGTTEDDDLTFTLEVSINSNVVANPLSGSL